MDNKAYIIVISWPRGRRKETLMSRENCISIYDMVGEGQSRGTNILYGVQSTYSSSDKMSLAYLS